MSGPDPLPRPPLPQRTHFGFLLPWMVLVFGLLITHQLWRHAQQSAEEALQADFDSLVRETNGHIEQRMAVYEQVLRGADGLFAHAGVVTRGEFRDYIARLRLKESYPGIQGIRFSPVVPLAEKERHIAAMRLEGMAGYSIHPEGVRDFYAPVMYTEPHDVRNRVIFGYDTYSDRDQPVPGEHVAGERRAAMEQARDTGNAVISGKVKLLFETGKDMQAGFLMFLPVYRYGAPHGTLAERRANLIGWISLVFRMGDLMAGILGERAAEMDTEIFDGEKISEKTLMLDTDGVPLALIKSSDPRFSAVDRLKIASHIWTVANYSLPDLEAQMDRSKPQLIGNGGIVTSILLALLTWLLVHGRERALQAARRMNRELIEREERLRLAATVFETVDEAVMVTNPDNRIIAVNPSFTRITGYSADEVIGRNPRMFSSGKHPPEFFRELWEALLAKGIWKGELWNCRKNGEVYVGWFSFNRVFDETGNLTHYVSVFSDISERKAAEERIRQMAHYDRLTNLPNRALFSDRFRQALAKALRDRTRMALLFIDLDKFKPVNDTHGHNVGDMLLVEVAKRLQYCVRGSDTVSRVGGDEFIVLLATIEKEQDAMMVAEKIRGALNQPFELAGLVLHISSSIGVALYPEHGSDEEQLCKCADIAMYRAKENGRDNAQLYRAEMEKVSR
ncbi:MAG: CHASE domain-containing protein [Nitrosomonadales bacterium]|nr:CHASE domain-containing protein [Nitrosomonadales bacterium]